MPVQLPTKFHIAINPGSLEAVGILSDRRQDSPDIFGEGFLSTPPSGKLNQFGSSSRRNHRVRKL
jgi:hypothetical protein